MALVPSVEINTTTRKFLETQLKEAFKVSLNVFKIFTDKRLFQFADLKPISSRDGKFSGKLDVVKNFKAVLVPLKLSAAYTEKLGGPPDAVSLQTAIGHMLAFQTVMKFVVFIDIYSKGAKAGRGSVYTLMHDAKQTVDILVRRFSQDAFLISEIKSLGKIFFVPEAHDLLQRYIYMLLVTDPFATPPIADIPMFLNAIFMIHRVMTKLLMMCQDIIPFLTLYGLSYDVGDIDTVLPPITKRSFGIIFEEAYKMFPDPKTWLDVVVLPSFYNACLIEVIKQPGESREITAKRQQKARESCPIFDDNITTDVNDDAKFRDTFKTVCAYMTSMTSKGGRGPKATEFANALLNTLTLVFNDTSFEYRDAIAGITDIYLRLYRDNQPMLPMFNANNVNYVFGPQTNPVRARQIYSPGIFAFQEKKGVWDAKVKKAVFRTLLLRRMIVAGAMIKALLEGKSGKRAYADLDGMNETKLLDEAKGIFEPGSYAIRFKVFN